MTGSARSQPRFGRLPADVTNFIGRREEIVAVKRLLSRARFVTLTGVGGAGKTRLALRVAGDLRRTFPDGVWHVDLAVLRDPSLVEYTVANALGIRDQTGRPVRDVVLDHLADRRLLLVLDNCEHLLDACGEFVEAALRAAPGLLILGTSRQALGIASEHVWNVPPMPVPDLQQPLPTGVAARCAALALFADRAAAASRSFALTSDNLGTVVRICWELDGLPLAIELAAARLRTMSVDQLAASLDDRFRLLATRHATPARHAALVTTFDWSFELCSAAERALWTRMSVFADSVELPALEYVCHGPGRDAGEILDVVAGLVDKSVLIREIDAGRVRYRLLETVRQYGLTRLRAAGDDESALRRRHRDWYYRLTEEFAADWFGPNQIDLLDRVRLEYANLRAALAYCLHTPGEIERCLQMAANLHAYWIPAAAVHEGQYWLDRALAAAGEPTRGRASALCTSSQILVIQGMSTAATAQAREALAMARNLGDPHLVARATRDLGISVLLDGDIPSARSLLGQAVEQYATLGIVDGFRVMGELSLALALLTMGEPAAAEAIYARCRAVCAEHGDRWHLADTMLSSAKLALVQRDPGRAAARARETLRLKTELNDLLGVAICLAMLVGICASTGAYRRAARLLGAAGRAWRSVGLQAFDSDLLHRQWKDVETQARAALGDDAFDAAVRGGAELATEDAVAYALGDDDAAAPEPAPEPAAPHVEAGGAALMPLTKRQREVATLVARGLSNRQIATELVISTRTAETHVENILRNLGFTSRAQVAAWLAEHGER